MPGFFVTTTVLYILSITFLLCNHIDQETDFQRSKRDAASSIVSALSLYHYPNSSVIAKLKVNTKSSISCASSGFSGGFYLNDIIGEANSSTNLTECLASCINYQNCIAINYLQKTKRCILLKSGATDGNQLFIDTDVADNYHLMFTGCTSKPKNVPTKLAAGHAPTQCGTPNFPPNVLKLTAEKIIGGTEALPYSLPWMGLLLYDLGGNKITFCGSSIIYTSSFNESNIAITAAHCVVNDDGTSRDLKKFLFHFGNHDNRFIEPHEIILGASKIIVHKNYTKDALKNDIAVIKLNGSVKFNNYIQPICLPSSGKKPKDLTTCAVCGWGRIYDNSTTTPFRLQQIRMTIHDNQTCGSDVVWSTLYDPKCMICAGPLDGTQNICQGDSGGSLACNEDGHWVLYGTSSFVSAAHCANINKPGVFAKVSAFRSFIDSCVSQMK